jgi:hypothetical protein
MSTDITEKPKAETKQLTTIEPAQVQLLPREQTKEEIAHALSVQAYSFLKQQAIDLAKSKLIPTVYQDNPANCLIAINLADLLRMDRLQVMQNVHIIQGRPTFSSKFLIALANRSGVFSPLRFVFVGEQGKSTWGCYATATELASGVVLRGTTVTMAMADGEGWLSKSGSKWKTMPEQMMQYRAASFFVNLYAPELTMGYITSDEAEDISPQQTRTLTVDSIKHLADDVEADPLGG